MPEIYYIIPMVAGPYSRENPQRPMYVDDIRCNWTGHNVDELGVYVCLVNTTEAKHTQLNAETGVFQLRFDWNTAISTLTLAQRTAISNWCSNKGIPYDSGETIGELLMRVVNSGLFSLGSTALNTQYRNLTQTQRDKISALCTRWGLTQPGNNETLRNITDRVGRTTWPGDNRDKVYVEEY